MSNVYPQGCGLHGDFYNGWDNESLYTAMKTDSNPSEEDSTAQGSCNIHKLLSESTDGTLTALPGCNAVTGKGPMVSVVHYADPSY